MKEAIDRLQQLLDDGELGSYHQDEIEEIITILEDQDTVEDNNTNAFKL